jgi:polygalacturonase
LLATGVDNLTIEKLTVDTNRDGFDIDACRNVRVANCRVNAPNDDAIVLKTSYGLGEVRATENVAITNCVVSGFDPGTLLDGTRQRKQERAPDRDGPTGRIKLGTESNGAFRNITITDCVFERSRGLALESVDGAIIEDVMVRGLTMREVTNPPIFIRLGNRARGPEGTPVGAIRRIKISQVTAEDADARSAAVLISGLPGHAIEDVTLSEIRIASRGGLSPEIVAQQPADLVNTFFLRGAEPNLTGPREPLAVPLREKAYPEPSMFGLLPAGAVYARHAKNLKIENFGVRFATADTRPRVVLDDVDGAAFRRIDVSAAASTLFTLRGVKNFTVTESPGVPDTRYESAEKMDF